MQAAYAWNQDIFELYCITCGTQILASGRYCPNCHTPTSVSRASAAQDRRKKQRLLTVLGASGAGKTVYLGMLLDILGKGTQGLRGIPNGSFSIAVQDQTISALEQRRFPEKTPSETDHWNWIHCEAFSERKKKLRIDMVTPDIAGEVLGQEIDYPGTSSIIQNLCMYSDGLTVLLDSTCVRDEAHREDNFAVKLVDYVADLQQRAHHERRKAVRIPFSFVLTKTDLCPEAENATEQFVRTNLPGLCEQLKKRWQSYEFFPASVVGTTVEQYDENGACITIPLHVQPRGIVEPLKWTLSRLDKRWR